MVVVIPLAIPQAQTADASEPTIEPPVDGAGVEPTDATPTRSKAWEWRGRILKVWWFGFVCAGGVIAAGVLRATPAEQTSAEDLANVFGVAAVCIGTALGFAQIPNKAKPLFDADDLLAYSLAYLGVGAAVPLIGVFADERPIVRIVVVALALGCVGLLFLWAEMGPDGVLRNTFRRGKAKVRTMLAPVAPASDSPKVPAP